MKILVLSSSFKKKGNTAGIILLLKKALAVASGSEEMIAEKYNPSLNTKKRRCR